MAAYNWKKIKCLSSHLQLSATLTGGQSFRWKKYELSENNSDEWIGTMNNCVWLLKQDENHLFYNILGELPYSETSKHNIVRMKVKIYPRRILNPPSSLLYPDEYYESVLRSYFRLDIDLEKYYKIWAKAHSHFRNEATQFYAVRVLNQDPVENLFSFICSQNNHISRITNLIEKLCTNYGQKICNYNGIDYFTFPDVKSLAKPEVEYELRAASFGYRAKFIQKSAAEILKKGDLEWFANLEQLNYIDAHSELLTLNGIGPKVADCICLMSLNHLQAIPVDTHVFQIAKQYYFSKGRVFNKSQSVTQKLYDEIGDKFREIYGPLAGWAQTVLFCADLKKFKEESTYEQSKRRKLT